MNGDLRWQPIHREYLTAVYKLGELNDRNGVTPAEVLDLLDLDEETGEEALEFLVDAGMLVWPAKELLILTKLGLKRAEELEHEASLPGYF